MNNTGCQEKIDLTINPIQDGGVGRGGQTPHPPTGFFSSVTSANVGISPQNFLTFSFNPFATLL